ncbi:MAG: hypothetical protein PHX44_02085 [Sulfurimonas sp.]|uniref:hypothetical protein n=1 Tax=Sulfurimonas sp. TaxID=2022749 RepID=UPI0026217E0B|nr:hypothetical protein [Sulfurimonas sp.]MDD2651824.1 hypothetical protein [Sulfurimonas sp.]MDD3451624.1 hypothetical protein [Sulfurimonas sp.]
MNLQNLQNKKILLFGKSRAFSMDEFSAQLQVHKIIITSSYSDDVALVVEGKMMTPYEQNESNALYDEHGSGLEFVGIDVFEKEIAKYIDANTLLMSLKLSRNKERLKSFLQNSMIEDALFFKLLKMYVWGGEDFFENDDNRDVSAAIILRFYKDIERNHNVQYATSGFIHLLAQTDNQELVRAMLELEPMQKKSSANIKIKTLIAMRYDCDEAMQMALYGSGDASVLEALCKNENLSKTLLEKLLKEPEFAPLLARYIKLDNALFKKLLAVVPLALSKNETLTPEMQEQLVGLDASDVHISLASNEKIALAVVEKLLSFGTFELQETLYKNSATPTTLLFEAYKEGTHHAAVASNPNTPQEILEALANSGNIEVLKALAQNKSTPVEILYQLQLDSRLARTVKENPAFGRYIQQENIGWIV